MVQELKIDMQTLQLELLGLELLGFPANKNCAKKCENELCEKML